jgi:hypothetical protein
LSCDSFEEWRKFIAFFVESVIEVESLFRATAGTLAP